ncbi:hypothetical protein NDU88_000918 [Pleurodeles waltl]|uniref:Lens epithelial cell protein LEP503 n=1 Tax=Pleurodeles waltl TaxID=8319 RepID=A0AAV7KQP2_PLEWA|nr:hypothetical protein NDU88_000918 [Pleurodeles waltl]
MNELNRIRSLLSELSPMQAQRTAAAPLQGPFSLGQAFRDMSVPLPRSKNPLGMKLGYPLLQSLKECLYFLLCCWCIKELLD